MSAVNPRRTPQKCDTLYLYVRLPEKTMDNAFYRKVRQALERSWSAETSVGFSPDAFSSYGQCAQTAIVVWETFGGEILRTTGWHGRGNTSTTASTE